MPELTLYRRHPERTPVRMVCMYCGAPAQHRWEWWETNRRPATGGGGGDVPGTLGDDPVSGVIGLLLLPLVLWEALKSLARAGSGVRPAPTEPRPQPKLNPPATLVTVTACDRHRRFSTRFVWAGVAMIPVLALLWTVAVRAVVRDWPLGTALLTTALLASMGLPLALAFWYTFAGPVIVDRVTEDEVILDRVRAAYFEATGQSPRTLE